MGEVDRPKRPVKAVPAGATRLSPPQVARRLQVAPESVVTLIRSGRLRALDLARPGSKRPRYRVPIESLEDFEAGATVVVPAKPPARRTRRDQGVTQFY